MALIKFGSVVTNGSGKLGGHVFQNSKGGMQLRTKPIPSGKPSLSQISIRSINKALQKGWRDLSDAQRKVWNDWAVSHSIMTVRDPHKPLSGHDLWMKYNYTWLAAGGYFLPDPSYWGGHILGPELIKNGGFDSGAFWSLGARWSISGGKIHYNNVVPSNFQQLLSLSVGVNYLLKFDVSNLIGSCIFRFVNQSSLNLFNAPYNGYLNIPNGHYELNVVCARNSTTLKIFDNSALSKWDFDNFSLKQIL